MNKEKNEVARAGTLLCVEGGCYSGYSITGFFVVLKDFTPDAELAVYIAAHPEQKTSYSFSSHEYLAHLLALGFLLEVSYGTLHLTDYRNINEFDFTPSTNGR